MKAIRLAISVFIIALFICSSNVNGQTVQASTTVTADGWAWCMWKEIYGTWTYHLTYHVDKKTGYINRIHINIIDQDVYLKETGERVILVDVGNDRLGRDAAGNVTWEWWNDPDNPGFDYEPDDFNIPIGPKPESGINVWATFRMITKSGEMFFMRSVAKITVNANGVTSAFVDKFWAECNPEPEF